MIDFKDLKKWLNEDLIDDDEEDFPVHAERENPEEEEEKRLQKRLPSTFYFASFETKSALVVNGGLSPKGGPIKYRRGHCYITTSLAEIKMLANIALEEQPEMSSIFVYKILGKTLKPNRFTQVTGEFEDAQYKGVIPARSVDGYTEIYLASSRDRYNV